MNGCGGSGRESIAHEYWEPRNARRYHELGYRLEVEAPREGGRVDVLAEKGGKRIALEIETGKSDMVANVRGCLRAGFDEVRVVATDMEALVRVEQMLGAAGLLIEGRVAVHLAGLVGTLASQES